MELHKRLSGNIGIIRISNFRKSQKCEFRTQTEIACWILSQFSQQDLFLTAAPWAKTLAWAVDRQWLRQNRRRKTLQQRTDKLNTDHTLRFKEQKCLRSYFQISLISQVLAAGAGWSLKHCQVEHAALGGSSCVFAYGATGSGKTHSILGASGCQHLSERIFFKVTLVTGVWKVKMTLIRSWTCSSCHSTPHWRAGWGEGIDVGGRDFWGNRDLLNVTPLMTWKVIRTARRNRTCPFDYISSNWYSYNTYIVYIHYYIHISLHCSSLDCVVRRYVSVSEFFSRQVYCEQIRDLLAVSEAKRIKRLEKTRCKPRSHRHLRQGGQPTLQCSRRDGQGRMLLDCVEARQFAKKLSHQCFCFPDSFQPNAY